MNYRVYDDLDRALASVETAIRPGDEVAVFDQSTDPSSFAEVSRRHPRASFVACDDNIGFAAAVNRLVRVTTSPYLLLLNPDAVVEGPVVDVLAAWLDTHPDVGLVGPRVVNEDGSVQASARRFPGVSTAVAGRSTWLSERFPNNWLTRRNLVGREATEAVGVDWLAGSCLMLRRELFDQLGGFDEAFFLYWEDVDFARRARTLGYGCTYLPTVTVRHTGGRSAAMVPRAAIRAFHRSAYHFYAKHCGPIGRLMTPAARVGLWTRGELRARQFRD